MFLPRLLRPDVVVGPPMTSPSQQARRLALLALLASASVLMMAANRTPTRATTKPVNGKMIMTMAANRTKTTATQAKVEMIMTMPANRTKTTEKTKEAEDEDEDGVDDGDGDKSADYVNEDGKEAREIYRIIARGGGGGGRGGGGGDASQDAFAK